MQLLIENGADGGVWDQEGLSPLHLCARWPSTNFSEIVDLLIQAGAVVNRFDFSNRTPLEHAFYSCNIPAINYLLECGADLQLVNRAEVLLYGMTCVSSFSVCFDGILVVTFSYEGS